MVSDQLDPTAHKFAEAELTERLRWFIRLRWLAAVGVVAGTLGAQTLLDVPVLQSGLLGVAIIIVAYNAVFYAWYRALIADGSMHVYEARTLAHAQISADLLCLGVIIHCSGGIENPLSSFFAFHMIIASMLLSRRMAYLQATLAVMVYGSVVGLEQIGGLPHSPLGLFTTGDFYRSPDVWLVVAAFASTLYLIVYMTTSITGRLREREAEAAELARQVAEKAAELQAAYDELQATQKLQITYMRKTSHELRSPLAAVASTLDVMAEGLVPTEEKRLEMLGRARGRIRDLMGLVNDLLTLLRSRAAPPRERFEAVGLEHVVESVAGLLSDRADQERVALHVDIPAGLPPVWGDDELLDQLCTNLLANGIKYTPEGGDVRISLASTDGHVALSVRDTGIGIAEEDQQRIFDEFYRTKTGRNFTTKGTGLGLAIVKSIADAHDAELRLESAPGEGSTFTVILPRGDNRSARRDRAV